MKLVQRYDDEVLPVAILHAAPDLSEGRANAAWRSLGRIPDPGANGETWLSLFDPRARPQVQAILRQVAASGQSRTTEVRGSGDDQWLEIRVAPDDDGRKLLVVALDVSAQKEREAALAFDATHDPLTGLYNRVALLESVRAALARLSRHPSLLAVLYLDLDDFKIVNDRHGHGSGDLVLAAVARRLRLGLRPTDVLGRQGGDEFVAVCEQVRGPDHARRLGHRLMRAVADPIPATGLGTVQVRLSVGIAFATRPDVDAQSLINTADRAMYGAKLLEPPRLKMDLAPEPLLAPPAEPPDQEWFRETLAGLARLEGDLARGWAQSVGALDRPAADRWQAAGRRVSQAIADLSGTVPAADDEPSQASPIG